MKYQWQATDVRGGVVANERDDSGFTHMVIGDLLKVSLVNFHNGAWLTKWMTRAEMADHLTGGDYTPMTRDSETGGVTRGPVRL
jgi:hypothetical protein